MPRQTLSSARARLFETVRSAHLERARALSPAAIVYRHRRYDFDERLADGLELVQAAPFVAAALLARSDIQALEVNEPLMLSSLRSTAVTLVALSVRRARRRMPLIVSYAIGNADPFTMPQRRGWRPRLRARMDLMLARFVWNRVDRVVFGTRAAKEVYENVLGPPRRATTTLIPALPERPRTLAEIDRGPTAVFLGAFADRKGFPLVVAAWPLVRDRYPDARLLLMGKGDLVDEARRLAADDPSVELLVDPGRDVIRRRLGQTRVLVLPSQRQPAWREQVGLPIVEGLEHGCWVVTTDETGLASWLSENGHRVVPAPGSAAEIAAAIIDRFQAPHDPMSVTRTLPDRDGRLAADDWLFLPISGSEERR